MLTSGYMDKEDVIYIHNGILFSHEKGGHSAICNNMGEPRACYAKINQAKNDKYGSTDMRNLDKTDLIKTVKWGSPGDLGKRIGSMLLRVQI